MIGLGLESRMRFSIAPAGDPVSGELVLRDRVIEDPEIDIEDRCRGS